METRMLAKITDVDFEIEDHGIPIWRIHFDYDDGSSQGMGGYTAEVGFMCRFLRAIGVYSMSQLKGRSCFVTHTFDAISKVEPLHKKDGTPFIISEWKKWIEKRGAKLSPHELVTGEIPK